MVQCILSIKDDFSALCDWVKGWLEPRANTGLNIKMDAERKKNLIAALSSQDSAGQGLARKQSTQQVCMPPSAQSQHHLLPHPCPPRAVYPEDVRGAVPRIDPSNRDSASSVSTDCPIISGVEPRLQKATPQTSAAPSEELPRYASSGFSDHSQHSQYRGFAGPPLYDRHVSHLSKTLNATGGQIHIPLPPRNQGYETLPEIAGKAKMAASAQLNNQLTVPATNKAAASKNRTKQAQVPDTEKQSQGRKPSKTVPKRKKTSQRPAAMPRLPEIAEESDFNRGSANASPPAPSPELAFTGVPNSSQPRSSSLLINMHAPRGLNPATPEPDAESLAASAALRVGDEQEEEDDAAFLARMRRSLSNLDKHLESQKAVSSASKAAPPQSNVYEPENSEESQTQPLPRLSLPILPVLSNVQALHAVPGESRVKLIQNPMPEARMMSPAYLLGTESSRVHQIRRSLSPAPATHEQSVRLARDRPLPRRRSSAAVSKTLRGRYAVSTSPFVRNDMQLRGSASPAPSGPRALARETSVPLARGDIKHFDCCSFDAEDLIRHSALQEPAPEPADAMPLADGRHSEAAVFRSVTSVEMPISTCPIASGSEIAAQMDAEQGMGSQSQPWPPSGKRTYTTDTMPSGFSSEDDSFHISQLFPHKRHKMQHPGWRATPESLVSSSSESMPRPTVGRAELPGPAAAMQRTTARDAALEELRLAAGVQARMSEQELLDEERCVVLARGFAELCEYVEGQTALMIVATIEGF